MCIKKVWEHIKRNEGRYWLLFILLSSVFLYAGVFPDYQLKSKDFIEVDKANETWFSSEKFLYDEFDITNIPGGIYRYIYNIGGLNQICFKDIGSSLYYGGEEYYEDIEMFIKFNDNAIKSVKKNSEVCQIISSDELFKFKWVIGMKLNAGKLKNIQKEEIIDVYPRVETYLKGTWWFKIFKFGFIFLSFGAVLWAWMRGFHLIRYGMWGK